MHDDDPDACNDMVLADPKTRKHVPGQHDWTIRRSLTDEGLCYEVRQCHKCHQMRDETRPLSAEDVLEATHRYKAVKQRLEVEKSGIDKQIECERTAMGRWIQGFLEHG